MRVPEPRATRERSTVESAAGVRVMHFYVDSTTPAAEQIRAATSGWDQGKVVVTVEDDPAWEGVSRFRQ